jgi:hypothetical protein
MPIIGSGMHCEGRIGMRKVVLISGPSDDLNKYLRKRIQISA